MTREFQGELSLYFSDLTEKAQKEVLEFYGLTDPCEANLDAVPITVLMKEDVEDQVHQVH